MKPSGRGSKNAACAALLVALAGASAGCGGAGPTASVAGEITIRGKQLPADAKGTIIFAPTPGTPGEPATAEIVGGRYECPTAPQGEVLVQFVIYREGPPKTNEYGMQYTPQKNLVPPQLAAGRPVTIEGDNPNLDFEL